MVAGSFGSWRAGGFSGSSFPPSFSATVLLVAEGRTKRTVDVGNRRDRIIQAAMRHFAERGYPGRPVADIALECGGAKGTVFLEFGSKEGLFLAAHQRAVSLLPPG